MMTHLHTPTYYNIEHCKRCQLIHTHTHTLSKYSKKAAGSEHGDVSQGGAEMRWLPEDHAVKETR